VRISFEDYGMDIAPKPQWLQRHLAWHPHEVGAARPPRRPA